MPNLSARRLAACVVLLTGLAQAASAAEILIMDAQSQPESHLFLRHACRCRYQHVVDVPANPAARYNSGAASYRPEGL
jgi:hypothetical protein